MALDQFSLEDAQRLGKANYMEALERIKQEWIKDNVETELMFAWQRLIDPATKNALRQRVPDAVREMDKYYGGTNG